MPEPQSSGLFDALMTRLGLGTVDFALSQDRDLSQRRLALFFLLVGGLEVALWALQMVLLVALDASHLVVVLGQPLAYLHLGVGGLLLVLARTMRTRAWSIEALQMLDAGVLIALGVLSGGVPSLGAAQWRPELAGLLAISFLLFLRSAIVPSHTTRTAVLGVLVCIPIAISTWVIHTQPGRPEEWPSPALFVAGTGLWAFAAITSSSVVSHVIYGLHRQVREALQLGQYTLEQKIGEGGMGVVYRARHALLRRPTAIKLLRAERGPHALARFEREVQLTSCLTHPNTIAIYDYGHTPDGIFYYVMEHLDGFDLERIVRADGPMHPGRVVHVLRQAADALGEAHGLGLIHRDVKPGNLLLCQRGGRPDFVKVLDFGLVRDLESKSAMPALSHSDALQGTPLYISPEQIRDPGALDVRTDIYSLGAVAYFLLTGQPVFEGKNIVEVCGHHLHTEPVRPSERAGRPLPVDLEALVLRCLAKDPAGRPRDVAELIHALDACEVPEWSDAEARRWWSDRAPELRRASDPDAEHPGTLAVDLVKRRTAA